MANVQRGDTRRRGKYIPIERWQTILRVAGIVLTILVGICAFAVLALWIFADPILNGTIKKNVLASVNTSEKLKLSIGSVHFNPVSNQLELRNILLHMRDTTEEGYTSMTFSSNYIMFHRTNWMNVLFSKGLQLDHVFMDSLICKVQYDTRIRKKWEHDTDTLSRAANLDSAINERVLHIIPARFKPLSTDKITILHGNYISSLTHGHGTGIITDSVGSFSFGAYQVFIDSAAIARRAPLRSCKAIDLQVRDILYHPEDSDYRLRVGSLVCSTTDSVVSIVSATYRPVMDDNRFFSKHKFRADRFRIDIDSCRWEGVDFRKYLHRRAFIARSVTVEQCTLNILSDRRPPINEKNIPKMPNEFFATLGIHISFDTVSLHHSTITYGEIYPYSEQPASLHFTRVNATIRNIANDPRPQRKSPPAMIDATGYLMDEGKLAITMTLPLDTPDFAFSYRGSMGPMNLEKLNSFLDIGERTRIKSGRAERADFQITVVKGHARGEVHAVYHDLKLAFLDKETGKEGGLFKSLASFIANTFKIHASNLPDASGNVKPGKVENVRKKNDAFMEFVWISLRSGIGDIIGL